MAELHFTLGEDVGIQLAEIAREHVQDLRLDKANSLWVDSFGCPEDMAEQLTAGKLVVVVDDPEKCLINVTERTNLPKKREKEYPKLNVEQVHNIVNRYFQTDRDRDEEWVFEDMRLEMSNVNRILTANNEIWLDAELTGLFCDIFPNWFPKGVTVSGNIIVMPRVMLKEIMDNNGDETEFEQFIDDANAMNITRFGEAYKLYKIIWVTKKMLNILNHKDQMLALEDFAIRQYGCDNTHKNRIERYIKEIEDILAGWMIFINNTESQLCAFNEEDDPDEMFNTYMKGVQNIDKMEEHFEPVDIADGYDAGWLASDGKYFGLNGSSGNFLHIALADKLMEYYHFEKPNDFDFSVDAFIAKQGFVKIHHDWVLYEGYDCIMTDKPVPLTYAQKQAIVKYGNEVYGGKLLFGYNKKRVDMETFKLMYDDELEELLGV